MRPDGVRLCHSACRKSEPVRQPFERIDHRQMFTIIHLVITIFILRLPGDKQGIASKADPDQCMGFQLPLGPLREEIPPCRPNPSGLARRNDGRPSTGRYVVRWSRAGFAGKLPHFFIGSCPRSGRAGAGCSACYAAFAASGPCSCRIGVPHACAASAGGAFWRRPSLGIAVSA